MTNYLCCEATCLTTSGLSRLRSGRCPRLERSLRRASRCRTWIWPFADVRRRIPDRLHRCHHPRSPCAGRIGARNHRTRTHRSASSGSPSTSIMRLARSLRNALSLSSIIGTRTPPVCDFCLREPARSLFGNRMRLGYNAPEVRAALTMTSLQRLLTALLPKRWAQSIEAESRAWMMQCSCGHETSVWDAGGIRYKAAGRPRRLRRCAACGQRTWHRIYKKGE